MFSWTSAGTSAVLNVAAAGQTTTGAIRVVVADEDGQVLPGAIINVESPEALGSRSTVADAAGIAIVPGLDPSDEYLVTVSLPGFNTARFENILVKSGSTTSIPAELSLAAVEAEIIITGESPLVDFSSAMTGEDLTLELMEALPTGRSYQSYLQLVPGVLPTDPDMQVTKQVFPLKTAVECIQQQLETIANNGGEALATFT